MNKKKLLFLVLAAVMLLSACAPLQAENEALPQETGETPDQAGAQPKKAETAAFHYEDTIAWDCTYDVAVIGFGGSGALASTTASEAGAKVLLVEKAPEGKEGGNTKVSSQHVLSFSNYDSGLAYVKACRDGFDLAIGDEYLEEYVSQALKFGEWWDGLGNTEYEIKTKADFPDFEGSDSVLVYYTETGSQRFWDVLRQRVLGSDVEVWFESPASHLIQDPYTKTVLGVCVENEGRTVNVRAENGVILACGGFENSAEMMQNYAGLDILPQEGYCTGDGITMAIEVGATLWHTGIVSGPYPCFVDPETGTNLFWVHYKVINQGKAAITVGPDGTRFYDESTYVCHGDADYHGSIKKVVYPDYSYVIFDASSMDHEIYGGWGDHNEKAVEKGYIVEGVTLEELAGKIGVDPAGLAATVAEWNASCAAGADARFGRTADLIPFAADGPYYALKCTPSCYNTAGGPVRNLDCEVLDTYGNVIPHLYSCGDLGDYAVGHYQAGFSLCNVYWTGRVAGEKAAAEKAPLEATVLTAVEAPNNFVKAAEGEAAVEHAENQYIGEATGGMGGRRLRVMVTYEDGVIKAIEALIQNETPAIGGAAIETLTADMIEANSADVDAISGATLTSNAFIAAVKNAIESAR